MPACLIGSASPSMQERCESVARELLAADRKLQEAGDVVSLRKAGA